MPTPIVARISCTRATRTLPTSRRSAQRAAQNVASALGQSMPLSQPNASHSMAIRPRAPTPSMSTNGSSGRDFQQVPLGVKVDAPQPIAWLTQPGRRLVLPGVGNDDVPQPLTAHQLADAGLVL